MRLWNAIACATLLATSLIVGCASEQFVGTTTSNTPPEVWLATAPPEGSTVHYQVHMFWGGFDEDGKISHFEYTITDNGAGAFAPADTTGDDKWHRTEAGDSVFIVTADSLLDSTRVDFEEMAPYEFVRSHTFFVRAVDDNGAKSKPAYRSFTARTLSPTIQIDVPRAPGVGLAIVPPLITFHWTGRDYVDTKDNPQDPHSVRTIIINTIRFGSDDELALTYIRENPDAPEWTDWTPWDAPGDSGRFWQPAIPLPIGRYLFAVQARDEAGAVSPVFDRETNVRWIRVDDRTTGPVLTVRNEFMRFPVKTSSSTTPPAILNVPAGLELRFDWDADASSYGGVVAGYRYGWDIEDLTNDDQWDISYTPFIGPTAKSPVRKLFYGVHTFHIETRDNNGFVTRAPITINVVPLTMDRAVLVIDDWNEGPNSSFGTSRGAVPSDKEHDEFWDEVLQDAADYQPGRDTYPPHGELRAVPLELLLRYKAIIWNAREDATKPGLYGAFISKVLQFNSREPNIIKMYLNVGGKVLICGDHTLSSLLDKTVFPDLPPWYTGIGPGYPVILRYELDGNQFGNYEETGQIIGHKGVGDNSFGYKDFCLNVYDIAYGLDFNKHRRFCRVSFARTFRAEKEGLRAAVPIDTRYDFPRLELRPEVSGPGKWFQEGILSVRTDLYNPRYFNDLCGRYAELIPRRNCFRPIYALECYDRTSPVLDAPIAYWLTRFARRANPDGVAARSVVWGFTPVYLKPAQVREALNIIMFKEWKFARKAVE
jgi:hypothetical protein